MPLAENLSCRKRETVTETEFYSTNLLVVGGVTKMLADRFVCFFFCFVFFLFFLCTFYNDAF